MVNLYDFILHRKFSGAFISPFFRLGLFLRKCVFFLHDLFGYVFFRHAKKRPVIPEIIGKILLIRTDRIGDIVLAMPSLKALRAQFPRAQIDIIVQKKYAGILNCYRGWTNVITINNILDSSEISELGKNLKTSSYDVAIVFHPSKYAYKLALASGAPCVIGWKAKGFGYAVTHGFKDDRSAANRHQVENNLLLLSPLGIKNVTPSWDVSVTDNGEKEADALFRKKPSFIGKKIFVLHPGSFSPRVQWLPERFAVLADRISENACVPIILGSKSDAQIIDRVIAYSQCKPAVVDALSLEGLVSFFKRAAAFIGNSTGPLHIAASVGIPTIGVYGIRYGMDRHELWGPYGKNGKVISLSQKCKNCLPWTCKDMICLKNVTVDMVWDEIKDLVKYAP
jgi:ADP-heptose:LPS heptosyltransferase